MCALSHGAGDRMAWRQWGKCEGQLSEEQGGPSRMKPSQTHGTEQAAGPEDRPRHASLGLSLATEMEPFFPGLLYMGSWIN